MKSKLFLNVLVVLTALAFIAAARGFAAAAPYTVAYASFGPLNAAIYIADADGSHERMLIEGSKLDMNPSFSPDGRWVLFTSRRDGSADVYRVQPDGTQLERLTDDPAFDERARKTPAAERIAIVEERMRKLSKSPTSANVFFRKKLLRMLDESRVEAGIVSLADLQKENSPFAGMDFKTAQIQFRHRSRA